ncbi:MAG: M48 family metalloprotease [Sphingomonadales bacterium]|jgi:Zn-dependent protease with chaperone function|nr:M48 family metalloprotease [Sphingomonadales bacterium]MBK9005108.1 M48 family metalloprotease [Sphingomonadales bacterium]MBK9267159.1 M48 family metalloprotease [Sphingomonadales bacterium]MBP6433036.1 M48 family metalloprotease [Sphingorhabdus sp.]
MKLLAALFAALALIGALATAQKAASEDPVVAAYRDLVAKDLRLATIGYHLASGSAAYCRNRWRNPGWVLHDERQYPDLGVARRAFTFRQPVSIAALVEGGPAKRAGLAAGDGLFGADGNVVWYGPAPKTHQPSSDRIDGLREEFATRLSEGRPVAFKFDTATGRRDILLDPPEVCASDFWVDVRAKRDAGADGERVRVTSGLVDYVLDDDELAAVVAHELAHNLLDHRPRINAAKSGKTKVIKATEAEADRLSVWLMANAGYDPEAAISFWQRYGKATGLGIFSAPTHYRWQTRVAMLREEIDRMASLPAVNGRREPPLLAAHRAEQ